MKKFNGTPGPWTRSSLNTYVYEGDINTVICDTVAENQDTPSREECEANAKLIAVAPDLLNCLQKFVHSVYVGCSASELNQLRIEAEGVINEALGE